MKINIRDYTDFKTFLKDVADYKRATNPAWSYGSWAKSLELAGTASLTMVISGQRMPGPKMVEKFCHYFKFNNDQKNYFKDLVLLAKRQKDPRVTVQILERLASGYKKGSFEHLDPNHFDSIANWEYYTIRELVKLSDFQEDSDWISKRLNFKCPPRRCKEVLEKLQELGLLTRDAEGRLIQTNHFVTTSSEVANEALRRFHVESSKLATQALDDIHMSMREFNALVVTLDQEKLPQAKKLIKNFMHEFVELMDQSSGDAVYQMNLQLFPQTKMKTKSKSKEIYQ